MVSETLRAGVKLSSENELSEKYRVPRMTVRNALTKLEEQRIV
ncbi:GntR family transcriptional regulator [Gracilibacillus alcaliphilus]